MSTNPRHSIGVTGPAENLLRTVTVILTDAQIKALPTTPITIVPAAGANKLILPVAGCLVGKFAGGAYEGAEETDTISLMYNARELADIPNAGADSLNAFLTNGGLVFLALPATKWDATWGSQGGNLATGMGDTVPDADAAVTLAAVAGGNFTGGHADNTLIVTVLYAVVDLV